MESGHRGHDLIVAPLSSTSSHPEQPDRIVSIYKELVAQGIAAECLHVEVSEEREAGRDWKGSSDSPFPYQQTRAATDEELETVHE